MRIIEHAAAMYDCTYEVKLMGATGSVMSDPDFVERIAQVMERAGMKPSTNRMTKSSGSEDFAYMMNRVQEQGGKAAFIRVHTKLSAPGHNRRLDFIESDYFPKSIKIFCAAVYDLLK